MTGAGMKAGTSSGQAFDPLQIYRAPLFRTMMGYKFLSGTCLLCGLIAVPSLVYTGQSAGYMGAAAVAGASLLPMTLQTIFVPHYVARISLVSSGAETPVARMIQDVSPRTHIRIDSFTLFGRLRSSVERIGDIRRHRDFRWVNWKGTRGRGYFVDRAAAGPVMRKVMRMVDAPNDPKQWTSY